jgi:uncharacterized UPF0160 family protein
MTFSFGTHDGPFHADEVTACALLLMFECIREGSIIRTRDLSLLNQCEYVCDVGGVYDPSRKRFDHHQAEYTDNLSSAGMVLKYLKERGKLSAKEYEVFQQNLILGVDAHDNGYEMQMPGVCTYSHIIASFIPVHHNASKEELEKAFFRALHFSKDLLNRMWQRYKYVQSCRQLVEKAMAEQKKWIFFDQNIPWMDTFFEMGGIDHPALFVIMPSEDHWKLRGIPPSLQQRMQVRSLLPKEWAGLLDKELKEISGIPGAIFCHKGRFISIWKRQEDALKALEICLKPRADDL